MKRWAQIAAVSVITAGTLGAAATARAEDEPASQVPTDWKVVRDSTGHVEMSVPADAKTVPLPLEGYELYTLLVDWNDEGGSVRVGVTPFGWTRRVRSAARTWLPETGGPESPPPEGSAVQVRWGERRVEVERPWVGTDPGEYEWLEFDTVWEQKQQVWGAAAWVGKSASAKVKDRTWTAMRSARVVRERAVATCPDGWHAEEVAGLQLWTDVPRRDLKKVRRLVKEASRAREIAAESLPGDPYTTEPPIVRVFAESAGYRAAEFLGGDVNDVRADFAIVADFTANVILVDWEARNDPQLKYLLWTQSGRQVAWEYTGGALPRWLNAGIGDYAAARLTGKARGSRPTDRMRVWLTALDEAGGSPLDAIERDPSADLPQGEACAWHWFFLHTKPGAPYRDAYERSLEAARDTLDPAAVRKAWGDTPMPLVRFAFQKYVADL